MTICVTIGKYEPNVNDIYADEVLEQLDNLYGIHHDFDHIQDLFGRRLQYDIYPKLNENEYKMIWNEKELKVFFEENALHLSQNIDSGKKFDGLILIISSHGIPDYIVSSDYKLYSRLAIQRTFSFYPILRTIPRLIIFDTVNKKKEEKNGKDIEDDKKENDDIPNIEITDNIQNKVTEIKEEEKGDIPTNISKIVDE